MRTLARLAILVVGCLVVFKVVLLPIRVVGISMLPTYQNGKVDFVNRLAYWRKPIKRGDIVGVRIGADQAGIFSSGPSVMLLKRVIALPGEQVRIRGGVVYINGQPLDEPYIKLPREPWNRPPVTLRPEEYLVIGDNRSMTMEQHDFGEVRAQRIVGKILF